MTLALTTRMMIETGRQLVDAVDAGNAAAAEKLAKEYLKLYTAVKTWKRGRSVLPAPGETTLTPRESRVVTLAREGHGTKAIAGTMGIAIETVKTHLRNARKKIRKSAA